MFFSDAGHSRYVVLSFRGNRRIIQIVSESQGTAIAPTPSYSVLAIKSLIYSWSRLPEHTVITTFCADQEKKIL